MIAGIENIEKEISNVLKKYEIVDNIEIRYSNLNNVDLQCNNLVRYSNNTNLSSIKKDLISLIKENHLIESIENFVNQEELIEILKKNKFYKPNYKNLSGGIVSIHSGWKI